MISIVICSINADYLLQIKKNISSTIGVEYELLVWNNLYEGKGICEVYNIMAKKAVFEYVCFLHEDIIFETKNWGNRVCNIFSERSEIGVMGVAGSKYKTQYFSGWYTGMKEFDCANITHRYSYGDELIYLKPNEIITIEEVVCLDGVFICCRKQIWETIKFDQQNLTGFHFYDIDFSVRASAICIAVVVYDIAIAHVTKGGDFGNNWVFFAFKYHSQMKGKLPFTKIVELPMQTDKIIIRTWLDVLKNYQISWSNKWKWINKQKLLRQPSLLYSVLKFLLYKPLGLRNIHKSGRKK